MTTNENLIRTGRYIAGIAQSSAQATISIILLNVIDNTINSLSGLTTVLNGFHSMINDVVAFIEKMEIVESQYIDPEDEAIKALKNSSLELQNVLTDLVNKKTTIDSDHRLNDGHCESLHSEYALAISSVASLIEALDEIRLVIIKHDLACEPRNATIFENVNDLIADLRQ